MPERYILIWRITEARPTLPFIPPGSVNENHACRGAQAWHLELGLGRWTAALQAWQSYPNGAGEFKPPSSLPKPPPPRFYGSTWGQPQVLPMRKGLRTQTWVEPGGINYKKLKLKYNYKHPFNGYYNTLNYCVALQAEAKPKTKESSI